jgi:subtilisin-like proprotein convertase family protein
MNCLRLFAGVPKLTTRGRTFRGERALRFEAMEGRELLSAAGLPLGPQAFGGAAGIVEAVAAEAKPQSLSTGNSRSAVVPAAPVSLDSSPLGSGIQPKTLTAGQYVYVIVTSSALANNFQPLINQKIADGLTATIVTTDYIYANYLGTESHASDLMGSAGLKADQIRQLIADAYATWGTRWVLLGGDTSIVPMRTVYANADGYASDNTLLTDEYYACPNGTWNGNGNSLWGDTTDGAGGGDINLTPTVYVGRVPASNTVEVGNFVAKDILADTTRNPNRNTSAWLSCLLDANTDGKVSNEMIISQILPANWSSSGLTRYESTSIGWTSQNEASVINILNAGPTLVNSLGHSNATYDSALTVSDIANLTNSFPYFMYSQGCDAGAIDQADPSIAEEQVVAPHGALGVVMNTNLGWYIPGNTAGLSHDYAIAFWNAVFNLKMSSPGEANAYAKMANLASAYSDGMMRWIDFETTLFGDPQTPLQVGQIGKIRGSVSNAANGNGVAGDTVFVDMNQNGTLDSSSVNLQSSNVPLNITAKGTFTSTLTAANLPGIIDAVTVTLNITWPWDGDLTAYLISPAGTRVKLFANVGASGQNFIATTLDDQAGTSITAAAAPFTGTFRPQGLLRVLNGDQPNGTWSLEISNNYAGDSGMLNSWSLHITSAEASAVTAADGSYVIPDLPDGTFQVRHVPQSGWTDTNPASSVRQVTIANGAIMSGMDFLTAPPLDGPPAVTVNAATVTVNEDQTAVNSGTWSEPGATDVVTLSASIGTITKNSNGTWNWSLDTSGWTLPGQITVTITASDDDATASTSFSLVVNNVTRYWIGGTDNHWATPANWNGAAAPQSGDRLVFPPSTNAALVNDFLSGASFSEIDLQGGSLSLSGSSIFLDTAGMVVNIAAGASCQFGIALDGPGPLQKLGSGQLVLQNSSTSNGAICVSAGRLVVSSADSLPNGGDLSVGGNTTAFSNTVATAATFTATAKPLVVLRLDAPPAQPDSGKDVSRLGGPEKESLASNPAALAVAARSSPEIRAAYFAGTRWTGIHPASASGTLSLTERPTAPVAAGHAGLKFSIPGAAWAWLREPSRRDGQPVQGISLTAAMVDLVLAVFRA